MDQYSAEVQGAQGAMEVLNECKEGYIPRLPGDELAEGY